MAEKYIQALRLAQNFDKPQKKVLKHLLAYSLYHKIPKQIIGHEITLSKQLVKGYNNPETLYEF